MLTAVGAIAFAVGLLASVMLHEAGHFLTARRFGMKATQFFVGFGPTLWSRRKGETEYGVKALPLGGFVKIVGMTPVEELEPGDEDRAFYLQPARRKTVVLAAGSTVHFLLCLLLVVGTLAAFGIQKEQSPRLSSISECVTSGEPVAYCGLPGGVTAPARAAGLRAEDVVVAVDGKPVASTKELTSAIRAHVAEPVTLTIERQGKRQSVTVTPEAVQRPDVKQPVGAIGVTVGARFHWVRLGPVETVTQTGSVIGTLVTRTVDTLTKKLSSITEVYGPDRDPEGFIGLVGAGRVSGEIASTDLLTTREKAFNLLLVLASLNLFVGVFNLLPLLPLDGGHIAVVWFEAVRDRIRRGRGYVGEIKRVDYNRLMPVTLAVIVLFASFTLFLLGADIVNPVRLTQ